MKRFVFLPGLMLGLLLSSCQAQTKDEKMNKEETIKPKSNFTVNKEYDKDGNLIRYDSTYSYYYSNIADDTVMRDSIFNQFRQQFSQSYSFSDDPFFSEFYFEDSLLPYDFYKHDFFTQRFRQNMQQMDSIFMGMDALKNDFFMQQTQKAKTPKKHKH